MGSACLQCGSGKFPLSPGELTTRGPAYAGFERMRFAAAAASGTI